jgi:hypothetical protein
MRSLIKETLHRYLTEATTDTQLTQLLRNNFQTALNELLTEIKDVPKIVVTQDEIKRVANGAFEKSLPIFIDGIRNEKKNFNLFFDNLIRDFDALAANKLAGVKGWVIKRMASKEEFENNTNEVVNKIKSTSHSLMMTLLNETRFQLFQTDRDLSDKCFSYYQSFEAYLNNNYSTIANIFIGNMRKRLFA